MTWVLLFLAVAGAHQQIRGLSQQNEALYLETLREGHWKCLDDSKSIPGSHVNDNYCDCTDGSDEPGTSACVAGKFYCKNLGYKPKELFSSHVNDGICDCCDGTDEWDGAAECPNACHEAGTQYRAKLREQYTMLKAALAQRDELVTKAVSIRTEKQTELDQATQDAIQFANRLDELAAVKAAKELVEAEERARRKALWDEEEDKRIAELQVQLEAKRLADEQAAAEREAAGIAEGLTPGALVPEGETIAVAVDMSGDSVALGNTIDLMNADEDGLPEDLNEEEVCDGWRQTGGCTPTGPREEQFDKDCQSWITAGSSGYCECANGKHIGFSCDHKPFKCVNLCTAYQMLGDDATNDQLIEMIKDADYNRPAPPKVKPANEEEFEDEVIDDDTNEEQPSEPVDDLKRRDAPAYTDEEAEQARKEHDEVQTNKQTADTRLSNLQSYLNQHYGDGDAFLPLRGSCSTFSAGRYSYEICLFGNARQNDGHSQIPLGKFSKFEFDNNHYKMHFTGGQRCWNGPDRSAVVEFLCGDKFEVISADEPHKCTYELKAYIPAACDSNKVQSIREMLIEYGESFE